MYPYQQQKARAYGIPGAFLSIFAAVGFRMGIPAIGWLLWVIASVFCVKACYHLAIAKGHDALVALMGFLGFFGLIVLSLLPDHHPEREAEFAEALEQARQAESEQSATEEPIGS